ncbi:MAG: hypothetical protein IPI07_19265 [Flavobacteriales bacterium]|nr:hypothetical protein [Flavobacteriales bacterium]
MPVELLFTDDDRILVTGFTSVVCGAGNDEFFAARFLSTGVIDSTFGEFGIARVNPCISEDFMSHSVLLSDGSVLLAGHEIWPYINDPVNQGIVAKLHPDGTPDTSYGLGGIRYMNLGADVTVKGLGITSDDKAVVCMMGGGGGKAICRLDQFGAYDTTFSSYPIPLFGSDTTIHSIRVQGDDKILLWGTFGPASARVRYIVRYHEDLTIDQTFGVNGWVSEPPTQNASWNDLTFDHLGRSVLLGSKDSMFSDGFMEVLRFNTDGTPDLSFGTNGASIVPIVTAGTPNIDPLPDGRIVFCWDQDCILVDQNGDQVLTFGDAGVASGQLPGSALPRMGVEGDGSIIVARQAIQTETLQWTRFFTDISTTVQQDPENGADEWSVFPNPFSDGLVVWKLEGNVEGPLRFELMQADGRLLYSQTMASAISCNDVRLDLPADLAAGSYLLAITSSKGTTVLPVLRSN